MKNTILMQLFILFAFSTICMAQRPALQIEADLPNFNMASVLACQTNLALGQPQNGIRTIEAVTQGYENTEGKCVFDVHLYVPMNLEQHLDLSSIKWQINNVSIPGNDRQISVSVPSDNVKVSVTYTIGNQQGAASRTF